MTESSLKKRRVGLSLFEIMEIFPDDATAEKWFIKQRWPEDKNCPHCGSVNIQSKTTHNTMPHRCRDCRKFFSVKTGTVMQSSKLGLRVWALAIYLLSTGVKGQASLKLHRDLGITQKSAWHLAHRIRETWKKADILFAGPIEVDETYIGGKEKNKHANKKLRAGRGGVGKIAVVGAKDRHTNKISAKVVQDTKGDTLKGFVHSHAMYMAHIFTDDNRAYRGLSYHKTVCHSAREYVRGQVHTNGIESFWSLFKRGYHGTYHHMSPKHLNRYVMEFVGRHNDRMENTSDQMAAIANGLKGKKLRYRDLTA